MKVGFDQFQMFGLTRKGFINTVYTFLDLGVTAYPGPARQKNLRLYIGLFNFRLPVLIGLIRKCPQHNKNGSQKYADMLVSQLEVGLRCLWFVMMCLCHTVPD